MFTDSKSFRERSTYTGGENDGNYILDYNSDYHPCRIDCHGFSEKTDQGRYIHCDPAVAWTAGSMAYVDRIADVRFAYETDF